MVTEEARAELGGEVSGRQIEQLVDELILFANISVADPPRLPGEGSRAGMKSGRFERTCEGLAAELAGLPPGA